ncbi:AraC family transcriptional regulator [Salinicola halimionae]|uniref:AraC family transcriptional regulator n=1 Tax=Salinicola halimionae TaxID=1949081 RepID=UPI000DA10D3B|nr:AraC family transcriptional regulator [Salinicola halimionae]
MAGSAGDWCIVAPSLRIERLEARFQGHAYGMHRHDTFAIGITLGGVQSFHYRRSHRHSLPGTVIVLHPDEVHDGHAGDERGFHYRILYVAPSLIQSVLGGKALPYLDGGLSTDPGLTSAVQSLLRTLDAPLDPLEEDDGLADLAHALEANSDGRPSRQRQTLDYHAASRVRDYLDAHRCDSVTLQELEGIAGQERWTLSRDFRALFGTSPYRYLTLRRLDLARRQIAAGARLTDVAVSVGFADQSHMTRAFGGAFGVTPSRWRSLLKQD